MTIYFIFDATGYHSIYNIFYKNVGKVIKGLVYVKTYKVTLKVCLYMSVHCRRNERSYPNYHFK